MSQKTRRNLLILSFVLLGVALALLIYSLVPIADLREVLPIAPTYLSPPVVTP